MTVFKFSSNRLIALALPLGLCLRLALLWADHQTVLCESSIEPGSSVPVTRVISIDAPDALVVIGPGPDGLPGRAGIDDGGNGTTDEKTELGATGSDDVCRVVFGAEANALLNPPEGEVPASSKLLIVQRGAFRPLGNSEVMPDAMPRRELIRWTDEDGQPREMLRDL